MSRPHPGGCKTRPRAIRRLARAEHPLAHRAASARVAFWSTGAEPLPWDDSIEAVAWRRESGRAGYRNRAHRRHIQRATPSLPVGAAVAVDNRNREG